MIEQEMRDRDYANGKKELANLSGYSPEAQFEWLRQAFLSQHCGLAELRRTINQLRTWAMVNVRDGHTLTVTEARLLNCCRICRRKPPRIPTVLSYGDEFACQECLP